MHQPGEGDTPMMPVYAELHAHSAYSFLDGASLPEELALQAHKLGLKAVALTDHDGLYGAMAFAQAAKAWGVQPVTGAEVTLASGAHLTLLVESPQGYANLCRLLSRAHLDHPRGSPRVEWELLARHSQGLIALTGCPKGEIPSLVDQGRLGRRGPAAQGVSRGVRPRPGVGGAAAPQSPGRYGAGAPPGGGGPPPGGGRRRHQQRALSRAGAPPAAGRAGGHQAPDDPGRVAPAAPPQLGVLSQVPAGDGPGVQGAAGGAAGHRDLERALPGVRPHRRPGLHLPRFPAGRR